MPDATKLVRKFTSWSFSRWSEYEECPFKAMQKHILKNAPPFREVLDRGNDAHLSTYDYLQAKRRTIPQMVASFTNELKLLRREKPIIESEWSFDINWKGLPKDAWFDTTGGTWLRVKLDLHYMRPKSDVLQIIDIKTGKCYEEKAKSQLETYGIAGLLMYPAAKVVEAAMWYTDLAKTLPVRFERKNLAAMQARWKDNTKAMFRDRRFPPRPGRHCTWCHLSKEKGGPCIF